MEGDLLSFVSLARLASGRAVATDVLALASNLVEGVAPHASGVWYLPAGEGRLTAADAFGPAADSLRGSTIEMGNRLSGWVAANRQTIVNSDPALDLGPHAARLGLSSCLSVPLVSGDTLAGVLTLYSSSAFTDDHGQRIEMVAPHLSLALQSVRAPDAADASTPRELRLVSSR